MTARDDNGPMLCPCRKPFPRDGGTCPDCGWTFKLLGKSQEDRDRELAERLAPYLADAIYAEFLRRARRQGGKLFSGIVSS